MLKQAGQFAIDTKTETFYGPKEYMAEQGSEKLDKILAGGDAVFNMSSHLSPDPHTAILVRMQTDYAGWKGLRQLHAELG